MTAATGRRKTIAYLAYPTSAAGLTLKAVSVLTETSFMAEVHSITDVRMDVRPGGFVVICPCGWETPASPTVADVVAAWRDHDANGVTRQGVRGRRGLGGSLRSSKCDEPGDR